MKIPFIILLPFFCINCYSQDNTIVGEWQFFNNDKAYFELTITDSFIYTYRYLRTPTKRKYSLLKGTIVLDNDSAFFDPDYKWSVRNLSDSSWTLTSTYFKAQIFRKDKSNSTVRGLYQKTEGEYKDEIFEFEKEVKVRIERLREKLNGL